MNVPGDFDAAALFAVVDQQLAERDMTVAQLNRELAWMSQKTFEGLRQQSDPGCQHILPVIQWVGRTPESFTVGGDTARGELLPEPGDGGWRWYWDMTELVSALETKRLEFDMSWSDVAEQLGTKNDWIKHLRKTRYGTSIGLAMRSARWLGRTAASFMWENDGRGLPWSGRRL